MWRTKYRKDLWKGLLDALSADSEIKLQYRAEYPYLPFMYCRPDDD